MMRFCWARACVGVPRTSRFSSRSPSAHLFTSVRCLYGRQGTNFPDERNIRSAPWDGGDGTGGYTGERGRNYRSSSSRGGGGLRGGYTNAYASRNRYSNCAPQNRYARQAAAPTTTLSDHFAPFSQQQQQQAQMEGASYGNGDVVAGAAVSGFRALSSAWSSSSSSQQLSPLTSDNVSLSQNASWNERASDGGPAMPCRSFWSQAVRHVPAADLKRIHLAERTHDKRSRFVVRSRVREDGVLSNLFSLSFAASDNGSGNGVDANGPKTSHSTSESTQGPFLYIYEMYVTRMVTPGTSAKSATHFNAKAGVTKASVEVAGGRARGSASGRGGGGGAVAESSVERRVSPGRSWRAIQRYLRHRFSAAAATLLPPLVQVENKIYAAAPLPADALRLPETYFDVGWKVAELRLLSRSRYDALPAAELQMVMNKIVIDVARSSQRHGSRRAENGNVDATAEAEGECGELEIVREKTGKLVCTMQGVSSAGVRVYRGVNVQAIFVHHSDAAASQQHTTLTSSGEMSQGSATISAGNKLSASSSSSSSSRYAAPPLQLSTRHLAETPVGLTDPQKPIHFRIDAFLRAFTYRGTPVESYRVSDASGSVLASLWSPEKPQALIVGAVYAAAPVRIREFAERNNARLVELPREAVLTLLHAPPNTTIITETNAAAAASASGTSAAPHHKTPPHTPSITADVTHPQAAASQDAHQTSSDARFATTTPAGPQSSASSSSSSLLSSPSSSSSSMPQPPSRLPGHLSLKIDTKGTVAAELSLWGEVLQHYGRGPYDEATQQRIRKALTHMPVVISYSLRQGIVRDVRFDGEALLHAAVASSSASSTAFEIDWKRQREMAEEQEGEGEQKLHVARTQQEALPMEATRHDSLSGTDVSASSENGSGSMKGEREGGRSGERPSSFSSSSSVPPSLLSPASLTRLPLLGLREPRLRPLLPFLDAQQPCAVLKDYTIVPLQVLHCCFDPSMKSWQDVSASVLSLMPNHRMELLNFVQRLLAKGLARWGVQIAAAPLHTKALSLLPAPMKCVLAKPRTQAVPGATAFPTTIAVIGICGPRCTADQTQRVTMTAQHMTQYFRTGLVTMVNDEGAAVQYVHDHLMQPANNSSMHTGGAAAASAMRVRDVNTSVLLITTEPDTRATRWLKVECMSRGIHLLSLPPASNPRRLNVMCASMKRQLATQFELDPLRGIDLRAEVPVLGRRAVLIIGVDTCHTNTHSIGTIVGIVSTPSGNHILSHFWRHTARGREASQVALHFKNMLQAATRRYGALHEVIVFQDGDVFSELAGVKEELASQLPECGLTFMCLHKRCNVRFTHTSNPSATNNAAAARATSSSAVARWDNNNADGIAMQGDEEENRYDARSVEAGFHNVVRGVVVTALAPVPLDYETAAPSFYLQAHESALSTARAVQYTVHHVSPTLDVADVQQMANVMANVLAPQPTKLPMSTRCAHKLADRAERLLDAVPQFTGEMIPRPLADRLWFL